MPPARAARVERRAPSIRRRSPRLSRDALVRSLATASDAGARRRLLARAPHLHDRDLVAQLNQAALAAVHVSLNRADHLARAARSLASRVGDDRALARSLRTSGHVLALRGEYRRAMANYRSALDLLASPADVSERAVTLSGALQSLIYLGDYEKAHAFAAEARAVFEALGDGVRLGRLESNVGNVLYRQDRFADALACYRRAHAALAERGEPTDVGIVLRNIAVCWISLNDFSAALQAYSQARAWCERHAMPRLAAENDYNVAYLHYLRGEYARAIELYRATRAYCERVGDPYHEALCDLDQSEIYLELNLNGEGEHLATAACRAFQALHMRYEMGKALVNIGAAAARSGEPGRALERFAEARAVFSEERNRHWLTITDLYRALVLLQQGNDAAAERLCRSAFAYFREQGPPGKAALCEMMLARLAVRAGRLAVARETTERAIGRAERGEATPLAAEGYFLLGEIHEAMGDSEAAYAAVRQAHAGLETLRSQIAGEQLKISFLDDKRAVYEALVSLALRREPRILRARVAFRYIEQAKSRSLADLMAFGSPLADPAGGRGAVSNLRRELTSWYRKIESHEGGPGRDTGARGLAFMRERARDCEARLVRAEAKLEHADAEYRVMAGGAALPLDAIRSSIPADAAVVEDLRGTRPPAWLRAVAQPAGNRAARPGRPRARAAPPPPVPAVQVQPPRGVRGALRVAAARRDTRPPPRAPLAARRAAAAVAVDDAPPGHRPAPLPALPAVPRALRRRPIPARRLLGVLRAERHRVLPLPLPRGHLRAALAGAGVRSPRPVHPGRGRRRSAPPFPNPASTSASRRQTPGCARTAPGAR